MKRYLIRIMPFWESKVIGIISKICLTYTTVFMGLLGGFISLVYGTIVLIQTFLYPRPGALGVIFYGLSFIIAGLAYIYHYIYAKKGFYLKNSEYMGKSYLMFGIAWLVYCFAKIGINIPAFIGATFTTIICGIPLIKAKKAFLIKGYKCEEV